MAERKSMVFYDSFYEAVKDLPPDEFKKAVCSILEYGLKGVPPSTSGIEKTIYIMAKPQIDKNNQRYLNGKMGGRKNQKETKEKPNDNQSVTKSEPNVNDNVNVNDNDIKDNTLSDSRALFERLWKLYPSKKGKGQVSDTQKKRLLAIGEPALVKAIERYSTELQKDADWRKPQNGSTFFNKGYVDYLDENYVPEREKTTQKRNSFNNFHQRKYDSDELEKLLLTTDS